MARIALLIPDNHPGLDREFVANLLSIVLSFGEWNKKMNNAHEIGVYIKKDWAIDLMREGLAVVALEQGYDYLLYLDSDMLFPRDLIEQMIHVFEQVPKLEAITGLYNWKQPPFLCHVYTKYDKKQDKFMIAAGFPLKKLFQVEGAAFGCLMIKAEVFKKMSRPYFEFKEGEYGEDLFFFRKFIQDQKRPIFMMCHPGIICQHMTQITVDVKSYIGHNKIAIINNVLRPTKKQLKIIDGFQRKLTQKFMNGPFAPKPLDKKNKVSDTKK